jgi:molybdenum cofactor cytidylyltransferase
MTVGGDQQALEALVLAAGAGARFGGGKLLAPWRGGVLLDGALAAAFAAPARSVSVVWGADARVAEAAAAFARAAGQTQRLRLVASPDHAQGLSQSLKAGVAALPDDCAGVFVLLGDMPRAPTSVYGPMVQALAAGAPAVAATFQGRRGHPVLFGRSLLPALMALSGDRGAGEVLKGLGARLAEIPAPDDGALFDVDRREDLG